MFLHHSITRDPEQLTARVIGATRAAGCRLETYRDGETFHVDIDLPGADPADIDVTVADDVMTVRASRHATPAPTATATASASASASAECTRQVKLSEPLDTDRLDARYDNGTLTVSIPIS